MEKITKKEFKKLIVENKNLLMGSFFELNQEKYNNIINILANYNIDNLNFSYARKLKKEKSNSLIFYELSNENEVSYFYFNSNCKYYRLRDFIIKIKDNQEKGINLIAYYIY